MDKFKIFVLPLAVLTWVIKTMCFVEYQQDAIVEFERLRLDTAVNYAIDAAVEEMVEYSKDLQLDYGEYEYLSCDPEVALDTFVDMYLENYNLLNTEANRAWVTATYCKAFVVATYDGYYVGSPVKINSEGGRDIVFTVKQPYLYKEGNDYYSLNMTRQQCKRLRNGVVEAVERPASLTEMGVRAIINGTVSDAFTKTVSENMEYHNTELMYLPSMMSSNVRTNSLDSTTAIVYLSDLPAGFGRTVDSFAIGGARIQHENFVGCYIRDGVKLYHYVSRLDDSYNLIETFETPMKAAEAGYEFDISLDIEE